MSILHGFYQTTWDLRVCQKGILQNTTKIQQNTTSNRYDALLNIKFEFKMPWYDHHINQKIPCSVLLVATRDWSQEGPWVGARLRSRGRTRPASTAAAAPCPENGIPVVEEGTDDPHAHCGGAPSHAPGARRSRPPRSPSRGSGGTGGNRPLFEEEIGSRRGNCAVWLWQDGYGYGYRFSPMRTRDGAKGRRRSYWGWLVF